MPTSTNKHIHQMNYETNNMALTQGQPLVNDNRFVCFVLVAEPCHEVSTNGHNRYFWEDSAVLERRRFANNRKRRSWEQRHFINKRAQIPKQ